MQKTLKNINFINAGDILNHFPFIKMTKQDCSNMAFQNNLLCSEIV